MVNIEAMLKEFFEDGVDGVSFVPQNMSMDLSIRGFKYDSKSKYETYDLGQKYHVVLYKIGDEYQIYHVDKFEAILTGPHVYISNLIKCGFFGVVSKKTKRSKKFINEIYEKIIN